MTILNREDTGRDDTDATRMSTQPRPVPETRRGDPFGPLRTAWRQLTSMRTALLLLFLLALAAVPGGFLPQRQVNPLRVTQYLTDHRTLGPAMDGLRLFDVFSSAWFAAIYLLLFVSLAGCLVPRTRLHLSALRSKPPRVPASLSKLPASTSWDTGATPEQALAAAKKALRGWRVVRRGDALSAEKGYLRETGNLVFHISLVLLLVGIALGAFRGFKGTVLVKEGQAFANTVIAYDDIHPGRRFDPGSLVPMTVKLDDFVGTYGKDGKALTFDAHVHWGHGSTTPTPYDIRVNHPLHVGAAKVYLIGHGYAPHVVVRNAKGQVVDDRSVPCLPQDSEFLSKCVVKVGDTGGQQLGFRGVFTPTTITDAGGRVASVAPGLTRPVLTLVAFEGDLGFDGGTPQSVYSLDTSAMTPIDGGQAHALQPGGRFVLPDGSSLSYVGTDEWSTFQVTQDPGKGIALLAAIGMVGGLLLSLFIRRRRVWVRVTDVRAGAGRAGGPTVVGVGGLARTDPETFRTEFDELAERMRAGRSEE